MDKEYVLFLCVQFTQRVPGARGQGPGAGAFYRTTHKARVNLDRHGNDGDYWFAR